MTTLSARIRWGLSDIEHFCACAGGLRLRNYQKPVAQAVIRSVLRGEGRTFLVVFPRQSGKNELQAQIEAFLLALLARTDAHLVKISPTMQPQARNAMLRLEQALQNNPITRAVWKKELDNRYVIGKARITFLSGAPTSNIVGATARTLLEVDEAQSVEITKYDKEIAPMAASTNATRVLWGTAWTSQTLLARELRSARQAEQRDGIRRVFWANADEVAAEVPAYGQFVAEQVARLGRDNPFIKSQFFCEEIDAQGGLFPEWRQALMRGCHPAQGRLRPGAIYAMLLDVAGEDEGLAADGELAHPARDATALTLIEVDLSTLADALIARPTYRAVCRWQWVGESHTTLYGQLRAIAEQWRARWVVVDATGIGAGLAGFLARALGRRVIPFTFNQASKSRLGWAFTALVDGGRYQEFDPTGAEPKQAALQAEFFEQLTACQFEILPGPARTLRWSVPDGARHPASGNPLHDDLVFSAALCAVLDEQGWSTGGQPAVVRRADPLKEMEDGF